MSIIFFFIIRTLKNILHSAHNSATATLFQISGLLIFSHTYYLLVQHLYITESKDITLKKIRAGVEQLQKLQIWDM